MNKEQRLAAERKFIAGQRQELAKFARESFAAEGRGAVVMHESHSSAYTSAAVYQRADDPRGWPDAWCAKAVRKYDPASQFVLVLAYSDGSISGHKLTLEVHHGAKRPADQQPDVNKAVRATDLVFVGPVFVFQFKGNVLEFALKQSLVQHAWFEELKNVTFVVAQAYEGINTGMAVEMFRRIFKAEPAEVKYYSGSFTVQHRDPAEN